MQLMTMVRTMLLHKRLQLTLFIQPGNTPLHWTATHNSVDCMLALLRHGADYKKLNNESESVLHVAVVLNRVEYMKTILYSGNEIDTVLLGPQGN